MPLIPFTINDEDSFLETTTEPHQTSALYYFLELDFMVDCARHVAADFFSRPQLYTSIRDDDMPPELARLHVRSGNDERVPSQEQRDEIYLPVFGRTGAGLAGSQRNFPRLRDNLISAAATFAERVYDTGVAMLRERVRTTHRPFKDYLTGLSGSSLSWSAQEVVPGVTRLLAYRILRDPGVCAVFGISTPPRSQWPFTEDANGDKLLEEIAKQVMAPKGAGLDITREIVSNRQRVALRGAEALALIVDFSEEDSDADLDLLITRCYTWGAALKSIQGSS